MSNPIDFASVLENKKETKGINVIEALKEEMQKQNACPDCNGTGHIVGVCSCYGMTGDCLYCGGDWEHARYTCNACNGTGVKRVAKTCS